MNKLVQLLSSVNMMQYYYTLTSNGVNGVEDCWRLTDDSLARMGMGMVVHRRKLLNAIQSSRPPAVVNNSVVVVCVQFKWGRVGSYKIPAALGTEQFRTGVAVLVEDRFEGVKGYDIGLIAGQVVQPTLEELASPFIMRVATDEELHRWGGQVTTAEKKTFNLITSLPEAALLPLKRCEYRFDMQLINLHLTVPLHPQHEAIIHSLFPTTQVRTLHHNPAIDAANFEAVKAYFPPQPVQPLTRVPEHSESEGECGLSFSSEASDMVESLTTYY